MRSEGKAISIIACTLPLMYCDIHLVCCLWQLLTFHKEMEFLDRSDHQ